ncbi:MAG: MarR family transcriptional regulator [Candidatus Neomarinimicrobiota bacterium]
MSDRLTNMASIFGSVFLLAQRWQYLGDQFLAADGLTTKQWMLLAVLEKLFDAPPTMTEAATAFGTSRQNVKQIALKLEQRGFLKLAPDHADRRILRLVVTEQSRQYWTGRVDQDQAYMSSLFLELEDEDLNDFARIIASLCNRVQDLLEPPTDN